MNAVPQRRVPELALGGTAASSELSRCITAISVRLLLGAPGVAEVTLADVSRARMSGIEIGQTLTLSFRSGEGLFDGEITAIEHEVDGAGGRVLRLRAYDRLHRLRKKQRVRTLSDVSLTSLIADAASEIGATAGEVPECPKRPLLIQHDASDFQLMTELGADSGLYLRLQDRVLDACSLAGTTDPAIPLVLGETLLSLRSCTNAETLRKSTKAHAWDPITLAAVEATAGLARQDAVEFRDIGLQAFSGLGERLLLNRIGVDHVEAEGLAQDDMDRAVGAQLVIEATATGDPALRPGRIVSIRGIADSVDGDFTVTSALHRFDDIGGYLVELSSRPPPRAARNRAPAVTIGKVTAVEDPEALGRARVALPSYGAVETGWMPVLALGAGASKGSILLPETDDEVLVLLPDGDPARGMILGGLYGADDMAEGLGWAGSPRNYVLRTPNGQKLTLHGDEMKTRLETGAGDMLEFGPGGTRIISTQDLLIDAPGRSIKIRAAHIDFDQG